ncbi:MAG: hypothetical protein ACLFUS_07325 [Candidatus Sumerlaeia bacterium]
MNKTKTLSPIAPSLRPTARKLNLVKWLEKSIPATIAILGLYASTILVIKMVDPRYEIYTHYLLILLPLPAIWAFWSLRRKDDFFAPADVAELADHYYENDGLITAYYEKPELYPHLDSTKLMGKIRDVLREKSPRLDMAYFLKRLLPVALYIVAVFLIPPRQTASAGASKEVMDSIIEPYAQQLKENEMLLPEERLKDLLDDLQQIEESKDGLTREKWEAIEDLEQRIDDAVAQSEQGVMNVADAFQDLTSSPGFKNNPLAAMQTEQFKSTMQDLNNALNHSSKMMPPELTKQMQEMLNNMQKQGQNQGGKQMSGADKEAMMKQIQQMQQQMNQMMQKMGKDNKPGNMGGGKGGLDRGRGDAALSFEDPEELASAKYEEDRLKNRFLSPEDMVDMGITVLEPEADPGKFSPGVLRSYESQQGTAVSRTRISPSQRQVVSNYFSSGEE